MRFLLFLLLVLTVTIDGRGGSRGGGRGMSRGSSRGRSRAGGSWGYHKGKGSGASGGGGNSRGHHMYQGSSGRNRDGLMGSGGGGGAPFVRKTPSSFYRSGIGSLSASTAVKTSLALAAYPLTTRVFGANVIREKESPLNVDGRSYYWSAQFVPKSENTAVCSMVIGVNDTLFGNISFTSLEKVNELAWSCNSTSTYCCGLSCCHSGYEGIPLGTIGTIGAYLLSVPILLIPVVVLLNVLMIWDHTSSRRTSTNLTPLSSFSGRSEKCGIERMPSHLSSIGHSSDR